MDNPWDHSGQRPLHAKLRRDWEIVAVCEYSLATLRERNKADRDPPDRWRGKRRRRRQREP